MENINENMDSSEEGSILEALKTGSLQTIKRTLCKYSPGKELSDILATRLECNTTVLRLSTGGAVNIHKPTPLALAIANGYTDVVQHLSSITVSFDAEFEVEDISYNRTSYSRVTALHLASIVGNLSMVRALITYGADVHKTNAVGVTPLFEACAEGHSRVVDELLAHQVDTEAANHHGITPLMIAAQYDRADVLKSLVTHGADLTKTDKAGRNVLFYTVNGGQLDSLVYLLDNGAKPTLDRHKVSILMEAISREKQEIVQYLLYYHKSLNLQLHKTDDAGRNAFFYLAHTAQLSLFQELLEYGVPIKLANDERTILMAAALHNNHTLVEHLLENKHELYVDVNARDNKGRNVLFYCITGADIDLFNTFLDHGALIQTSNEGITLLMQAVAKHRRDYIEYFLQSSSGSSTSKIDNPGKVPSARDIKIDIQAEDKDGWNAVFYAVASNHSDILQMLFDNGALPEPAVDGRTILMQAALKGSVEFVEKILEASKELGVDINEKDNDGWSALWYTIPGTRIDIFNLLIAHGAKLSRAKNGSNVLHEAVDKGKRDMVAYLLEKQDSIRLDITEMDSQGNNAAMYAAATGNLQVLKILVEAGVPIESDSHGRSILHHACVNGSLDIVEYLLSAAPRLELDIHQVDQDGRNALFYCIDGENLQCFDYLIQFGVKPTPDRHGRSLLMHSAQRGLRDICEYLLEKADRTQTDVNQVDSSGENALFYASLSQKWAVVDLLIHHGITLNGKKDGVNLLAKCMKDRQGDIFQEICSTYSLDMNGRDTKGIPIFHYCIMQKDLNLLMQLAPYFDPNRDADVNGITSAMRACYVGNIEILKYLVKGYKVDITLRDKCNRDVLYHAVQAGNINAVTYLLSLIKTHEPDQNGRSLLMVAAQNGHHKITELLLRSPMGRDLLLRKAKSGQSAVHFAAAQGRQGVLAILDRYLADLQCQDIKGATPLMLAAENGHINTLTFLLRKGSNVNTVNLNYQNALHYCFQNYPNVRCTKLLVKFGINTNQQDSDGVTPLMLLCKNWSNTHITAIKLLLQHGADPVLQDSKGRDVFDYCPWDAEYVKELMRQHSAMPESEQNALMQYKPHLPSAAELNSILRELQREGIFTSTLYFEVVKQPAADRVSKLLDILFTRGPRAFAAFCRALKDSGYIELYYNLSRAAFKKSVEVFI